MTLLSQWWQRLEQTLIALLSLAALLLFIYGMLSRALFPRLSPSWVLELTIFMLVWAMLLGGGILVAEGKHIQASVLAERLPKTAQRWLEVFTSLLAALYCGAMAYYGREVVAFALQLGERSPSTLQFPMAFYYLALPISMGLMALRYVYRATQLARGGVE